MADRETITSLIDRIVADARIPGRREREDLKRELQTHFEDAARARGSVDEAITTFGRTDEVATELRGVYRVQRLLVHAFRIAAGLTASVAAALLIELTVSRPGTFRAMASLACMIVVSFVIAREAGGRWLRHSTWSAKSARWVIGFLALAAWEYGIHNHIGVPFGVLRAAAAGGVLVSVAAASAVIMAGADRAFITFV
ncbi:MAG TPA: hypothetical protein VFZ98_06670 [Vicinamibacterales bacterium]